MEVGNLEQEAKIFQSEFKKVYNEVAKVIVGQKEVVEGTITALICGGNVLLEGVPGLGKTELVKTLGKVLDLDFSRVQFTPDLMPADIIGTNLLMNDDNGNHFFEFRKGPIFTQILLADEINRATPKTQSALLEIMQEASVTTGNHTYTMKQPYFVMATQNPLEQEGTYPLPEAQLDRFMFKINVPFPSYNDLTEIVTRTILKSEVKVNKILN
jgi:MoxR-like ATPase